MLAYACDARQTGGPATPTLAAAAAAAAKAVAATELATEALQV